MTTNCHSTTSEGWASRPYLLASGRKRASGLPLIPCIVLTALLALSARAQIQQAWVATYNNGILGGTNQAVKMALDPAGNIYVTGFSQNANTNLGYVTIKYAPNGHQLWAARYDSTNDPSAVPAGLVLDGSNNVVVTGSALTAKYDANGNQLWTAPYSGAAVAMDTGGNSVVTGFDSGFNTVKISPAGTNLWFMTYISVFGPAASQVVAVDGSSNVYVAGANTYACGSEDPGHQICVVDMLMVKYDQNGNQLWTAENMEGSDPWVQVAGLALDSAANIYVVANGHYDPYSTFKYAADGSEVWAALNPDDSCGSDVVHGLGLDSFGNVFVTGQSCYFAPNFAYATFAYGTYKANTNGSWVWTNSYPSVPVQPSVATSIAIDSANGVYVTGYSTSTNSGNDIVTIKYDPNGNQVWLQRYNGPGSGDDEGKAIAVDKSGNVYVTGYETTAAGGTEIVTLKYSPVALQRRTDGTVLLQAQGSPGESFDIRASADLQSWLDLGSVTADTNGLMQFDDTNAPHYNARFYVTSPQ